MSHVFFNKAERVHIFGKEFNNQNLITMKTLSLLALNLCFTVLSFAQQGILEVNVKKINTLDGKIYVAVYTEDNFLMAPILSSETEMEDKNATAIFEHLDHGTYAIAAYQDVNANDKLDRDEYGRPTEPWALSGSQASMVPIWIDSKVEFKSKTQKIDLKL